MKAKQLGLASALLLSALPAKANLVANANFSGGAAICDGGPGGTCPDWTVTPAPLGSSFLFNDDNKAVIVPPGVGFATFGGSRGEDDELSQVLATVPGQTYMVSFDLAGTQPTVDQDFSVKFGSTTIFSEVCINEPTGCSLTSTLTPHTFDITATGSSTTLAFFGRNTPATDTLADIDVEAISGSGTGSSGGSGSGSGGSGSGGTGSGCKHPHHHCALDPIAESDPPAALGSDPPAALDPIAGSDPPAVPEPSTWAMMLLGLAGLGCAGFRRRPITSVA
jgi:hypothetical protein